MAFLNHCRCRKMSTRRVFKFFDIFHVTFKESYKNTKCRKLRQRNKIFFLEKQKVTKIGKDIFTNANQFCSDMVKKSMKVPEIRITETSKFIIVL